MIPNLAYGIDVSIVAIRMHINETGHEPYRDIVTAPSSSVAEQVYSNPLIN